MKRSISKEEYKEIFDTHYDEIMHFLYYKSGDIKLAEDLVQDVFYLLWEKREGIQIKSVRAYLYKIAGNLFISRQRKVKVEYNFRSGLSKQIDTESPEFVMEFNEFNIRFQKALANLKEKQRIVFLMNRVEALSYSKIAERLDISIKTVEKRMSLALQIMNNRLKLKI